MIVKYCTYFSGQQVERCISGLSQNGYSVVRYSSFKNQKPSKEDNVVFLLSFLTQLLIAHIVFSYFSDHICCLFMFFSNVVALEQCVYDAFSNEEIFQWNQAAIGGAQCCISRTGLQWLLFCSSIRIINAAVCELNYWFNWLFLSCTGIFSQPEPAVLLFMSNYVPFLCPSLHLICTEVEMELSVTSHNDSPPPQLSYIRCQHC